MLILFWPKSSAMCKNLRCAGRRTDPQGLKPAFPVACGGPAKAGPFPKATDRAFGPPSQDPALVRTKTIFSALT